MTTDNDPLEELDRLFGSRGVRVGPKLTSEDIQSYGELTGIRDASHRLHTVLREWSAQQNQDRDLRKRYATWLMIVITGQMVLINVAYALTGFGLLTVDAWTSRTFLVAVFAEIAAMASIVVRSLFPPRTDQMLNLIHALRSRGTDVPRS